MCYILGMETEEIWRDVVGAEQGYQVSNLGRVYSKVKPRKEANTGRILRPGVDGKGYKRVAIYGVTRKVHHLVLEAFVGPRKDGEECGHLDGDAGNNRLDNLAWKTPLENAQDKLLHGTRLMGERQPRSKLTDADVIEIRRLRATGAQWTEIHRGFKFVALHTIVVAGNGTTFKHLNGPDFKPSDRSLKLRASRIVNGTAPPIGCRSRDRKKARAS